MNGLGTVIVNNVKLSPDASFEEAFSVATEKLRKIGIKADTNDCRIFRKSIDARRKNDIKIVYSVAVSVRALPSGEVLSSHGMSKIADKSVEISIGGTPLSAPPIVVGTGPAGLFAALLLAEAGYAPVVLERGGDVKARRESIERLNKFGILDPETNIQFGAGGAGTFSDGKLVTRVNDPYISYVLDRFIEFGAPSEIAYMAKPHIGTDILSLVVENMLAEIERLGGTVCFNTKFISANVNNGAVTSVKTSRGDMPAGALILAIGHSARDTYSALINDGYNIVAKDFSVGMRIEHKTVDIDRAMYGDLAGHPALGHAEYNLSHNTKVRGVYTFCMCPGGTVVAAASEFGGVVSNGMSENARSGENSNSAVVASVFRSDYGASPMAAIDFQRKIEQGAFKSGGSDYSAPIITVGDFLSGELKNEPSSIKPTYMNGEHVKLARPEEYLPRFVTDAIKGALPAFDKKIQGFGASDAILTGAETRTSAPVRIIRDNITHLADGYKNIYPAGEGAGYAGGITSAAIDGIRTALCLMQNFKP